jgi:hypothetical protein
MVIARGALFPDLQLAKPQSRTCSNASVMPCMVLPIVVALATDTRQASITGANVAVESNLCFFNPMRPINIKQRLPHYSRFFLERLRLLQSCQLIAALNTTPRFYSVPCAFVWRFAVLTLRHDL